MLSHTKANHRERQGETDKAEGAGAGGKVVRLSMLVACASVLQVAEALFPHPLPGVRLGLANIITVIALVYVGPGSAIQLAVLRTLVSSMVLGTFLTPTFVLSLSGAVLSAVVMALLYRASGRGQLSFSLVGISVGGAVSHIATQMAMVYLLFIRSSGVLWLWPWLCLAAVATGLLTGMIAIQAVRRLESGAAGVTAVVSLPVPDRSDLSERWLRDSVLRRLRPETKIGAVIVVGLVVVVFSGFGLYLAVFALLVALAALGHVGPRRLAAGLRRIWPLLVMSLLLPVVFSPWGRVLFAAGPLRITDQGLHEGAIFAARILLLFFATALLSATTVPRELAVGLERLLRPLRVFRIEPGRLARSLSMSWTLFPQFQQSVRGLLGTKGGRRGWFDRTVHLPGDVVADMFRLAERGAAAEERL